MKINNKNYVLPELNFNAMCKLEDMGVSITLLDKKPMATIRGFLALAIGDVEKAGTEIEEHIANGGNFEDILKDIVKAVSDSGFFRALGAKSEKRDTAIESQTSEK